MKDPDAPNSPAGDAVNSAEELAEESSRLSDEDAAAGDDAPDDPPTGPIDPDQVMPVEEVDVEADVDQDGDAPESETLTDAERADIEQQIKASGFSADEVN